MPSQTGRKPRVKAANPAPEPPAQAGGGEEPGAFRETTVAEFLGLDATEMRVIDLKISLVRAIRERRRAAKLTQKALAERLEVAPARIVEMERGNAGVSLDAIVGAYFATGATGADLAALAYQLDAIAGT